MTEELISKKELLELTGISYGQLYRWKRKNLVPDAWFIRKSAFTGQETFFPKQQMLARIDHILNMKDDLSLDELADMFSPLPAGLVVDKQTLVERNIVSKMAMDYAQCCFEASETCSFEQALFMYMLHLCLQTGELSLDEVKPLLRTLDAHYKTFEGRNADLMLIRKMGVPVFALVAAGSEIYFEGGARLALRISIAQSVEDLKLQLTTR